MLQQMYICAEKALGWKQNIKGIPCVGIIAIFLKCNLLFNYSVCCTCSVVDKYFLHNEKIFFKVKICDHNPNICKTKHFNNYRKTLKLKIEITMEK